MSRKMVEEQCPRCGVRFKSGPKYRWNGPGVPSGPLVKTCPNGHTTADYLLRKQRRARGEVTPMPQCGRRSNAQRNAEAHEAARSATFNDPEVLKILEDVTVERLAIHGLPELDERVAKAFRFGLRIGRAAR